MNIVVEANESFREVDASKKRYIVMKGSAGSGKSVDTAQHYILRLMKDKGRNLVCVRKSDVTNRDSTYSELMSALYRMFGDKWVDYWKTTLSPLMLECKLNGNQIIFRGVNDDRQREKLKSITFKKGKLTDVWIEEATELNQSDVEIIDDRLRGALPEGLFYQIRMTFNPVSASHWIKKVYFDRADEDVLTHHSTYLENRFIDEAYHKRMERRKEVDPEGYKIYGLGEWGETSGLILSNWKTCGVSQDLQAYDGVAIGQDFGFNHANAVLLLGWKDGDVFILSELYGYEKDTSEWIAIANQTGLPKKTTMYCDSAEPDRIKMWKKGGYRAKPVNKEKNSVHAQIDWLKQRMIYVHPSCTNTIKELEQWRWQKNEKEGVYVDEPVSYMDDAMAALRYGVEGWRKPKTGMMILK